MGRGMSLSVEGKPTKATSTSADRTKPAGKNLILVGGVSQVDFANYRNVEKELFGGHRRSAAGRDKIKPGQNPNVDVAEWDSTADPADSHSRSTTNLPRPRIESQFDNNNDTLDAAAEDWKEQKKLLKHEQREREVADEEVDLSIDSTKTKRQKDE